MNPPPNDPIPFEKDNQHVSPPPLYPAKEKPHVLPPPLFPAKEKVEKKSGITPIAGSASSPIFFSDPDVFEPAESDDNEEDFHTYVRNLNCTTKWKVVIMESASEGRDEDFDDVNDGQDFNDDEENDGWPHMKEEGSKQQYYVQGPQQGSQKNNPWCISECNGNVTCRIQIDLVGCVSNVGK